MSSFAIDAAFNTKTRADLALLVMRQNQRDNKVPYSAVDMLGATVVCRNASEALESALLDVITMNTQRA